jgi:hypothetical protein
MPRPFKAMRTPVDLGCRASPVLVFELGRPPPPPTRFHASRRRFTQNSSGQSKMPIDSNHVSTAIPLSRAFSILFYVQCPPFRSTLSL